MSGTDDSIVRIEIAPDRLRAFLIGAQCDPKELSQEVIAAHLRKQSISVTPAVEARIGEFVSTLGADGPPVEPFLVAEGRAPVHAAGARFEPTRLHGPTADDTGPANFHLTQVATATLGDAIGELIPEVLPQDGLDVSGRVIPATRGGHSVRLGKNVRLAEDGRTVLATAAGKVHIGKDDVSVLNVVEIEGDVDFSTGDIDAPTRVSIKGTIRESFTVKSAASVSVAGAIEAAVVQAGGDVEVSGGIVAQGVGRVTAGGNIVTRFCDGADLEAAGDVVVLHEARNSRVYTSGRLDASGGAVIGGYVYAREGAKVKELGNDAEIPTCIAIGIDPAALVEAASRTETIKKKEHVVRHVRTELKPLMDHVRRLTPQQREHATELLYHADQIGADVERECNEVAACLAAKSPKSEAILVVSGKLFPGVTIILGDKMALIHKVHRGPIRLLRRSVEDVDQIVLVDEISGSTKVLLSMPSLSHRVWNRVSADPTAVPQEQVTPASGPPVMVTA